MNEHLSQGCKVSVCEVLCLFLFVRNAHQRDNKAIRMGCVWHGRGCWGDGGRDMGTRNSQEDNLKDIDSFSTYFLSMEGVNILYSKGFGGCFNIAPFSGKSEITDLSDSQQ